MTIKDAMGLSDGELARLVCADPNIDPATNSDLREWWFLIHRDPSDRKHRKFWDAMGVIAEIDGFDCWAGFDLRYWLVLQPDPARVARIICVCWLAAEGKVEA